MPAGPDTPAGPDGVARAARLESMHTASSFRNPASSPAVRMPTAAPPTTAATNPTFTSSAVAASVTDTPVPTAVPRLIRAPESECTGTARATGAAGIPAGMSAAGMSAVSDSSSEWALSACPTRSSNSSLVSRPSANAARNASRTDSMSIGHSNRN